MRILVLIGLLLPLTLIGCGGGGGGGDAPAFAPERPSGDIQGKVVDATLIGATVRAYRWDQGAIVSDVLAETQTDNDGRYTLSPQTPDGFLLLEATGGYYIEEASGTRVELQDDQRLTALVRYESGSAIAVHITTLTHWAACQATWRATVLGQNTTDAINLAYEVFSTVAGVPIRETEPLDMTDPNLATHEINSGHLYGAFSAGVSRLTQALAEQGQLPVHTRRATTSIEFAQLGCTDLLADGQLDGLAIDESNQSRVVGFAGVPLSADLYRTGLAREILKFARSEQNQSGLGVSAFLNRAQALSTLDAEVFANTPPLSVDLDGPVVSSILADNTFLKGTVDLVFVVEDALEVATVDFYLDGQLVMNGSAGNTTLALNTAGYPDGTHTLRVVATDVLGNETTFEQTVQVDNSGPIVNIDSPTLVGQVAYTATGSYQLDGAAIAAITVNDVEAVIDPATQTWSAGLRLTPGRNPLVMRAIDMSGNTGTELVVDVDVDTTPPTITNDPAIVRFSTGQNQFNLCNVGQLEVLNTTPVCLRDDRVNLDGRPVTNELFGEEFVTIEYQVEDRPVDNIFTPKDEIKLEYRVDKDGSLFQDWRPAPPRVPTSTTWVLPMTTEFLGEGWYQTSIESVFTITLRATDAVGNETTFPYTLKFDVLPNTRALVSDVTVNSPLDALTFPTRQSASGQNVKVVYTYENPTDVAYFIRFSDGANHSVDHTYETLVTKNRARINRTENWRVKETSYYPTQTVSDWIPVTGLKQQLNDPINVTPQRELGTFEDVFSTNVATPPASAWTRKDASICVYDPSDVDDLTYAYNLYVPSQTRPFQAVCVFEFRTVNGEQVITPIYEFDTQWIYDVEIEAGYPKNEAIVQANPSLPLSHSFSAVNADTGSAIATTRGWLRIPPATTVLITKSVALPALPYQTDGSVATPDRFENFTPQSLDTDITWSIDTDLTITRVVDPGDIDVVDAQTPYTVTVGNGIITTRFAR